MYTIYKYAYKPTLTIIIEYRWNIKKHPVILMLRVAPIRGNLEIP